ncbi:MAG: hypothetical protein JXQ83_12240 [Candidatus Glassbacteria bacterium]|nr:hypothetical protein [Candidatus Glassbacteria bacterium]
MLRTLTVILFVVLLAPACGEKQPDTSAAPADTARAPVPEEQTAADTLKSRPKSLLEYSTLDTCDGVFEGSYEEEHGEIIVRATVLVSLKDCRVDAITFLDSTSLNSEAIKVIPERIIETQMLPVEAVTGASVSSWTIMTATALALGIDLLDIEEE